MVGAEPDGQVLDRVDTALPSVDNDPEHVGVVDEGGWLAHSWLQGRGRTAVLETLGSRL
jgi:hypothetical protein